MTGRTCVAPGDGGEGGAVISEYENAEDERYSDRSPTAADGGVPRERQE